MNLKKIFILLISFIVALVIVNQIAQNYTRHHEQQIRKELFAELKPVHLKNCKFARFGDVHDGGYIMCENLLKNAEVAYSYGIEGRDIWGCEISKKYKLTVHQYDCFNLTQPVCDGGKFSFHGECIGDRTMKREDRLYDTYGNQLIKNGDAGKKVVMKMDVEGSEWDSLISADEKVLMNIEQLSIEMHRENRDSYLKTVRRLKKYFYIASVHFNNNACDPNIKPFPSWAYEVLFVNKRLTQIDTENKAPVLPISLNHPNTMDVPDCQAQF